VQVIVVDNASTDDSLAMLAKDFPQVSVIQNSENLGFSAANNQAINDIQGKYTLILNPDTLLAEDTLESCFDYLENHPKVGALGVKMLDGAGNFHKESKRGYPSIWASVCKMTGVYKLFPKSKLFNSYYQGHIDENQIAETEVLCGAFMFMPSAVFKDMGGFDEAFFMYGEDIDLSYRITEAGYSLIYLPKSSIIHYKGESRRRVDSRYVRSFYGSMDIFLRKHSAGFLQKLLLPFFSILIAIKAGTTYFSSILRNLLSPILDFALICLAQVFLKNIWEKYYFKDIAYYDEKNVLIIITSFSALLVLFQFLSGKYDEKYSLRNISVGFKKGSFGLQVTASKAALLIGSKESAKSFKILSDGNQLGSKLIGYVFNEGDDALGAHSDLNKLIEEIPTDEIIFSAKDIDYKFMQEQMATLGSRFEYKILSEDSTSLLSSNFANKKGSIYTIQTGFKIDDKVNKRLKRGIDLIMSIALLILSPILIIVSKLRLSDLPKLLASMIGTKTLISYNENKIDLNNFPRIKDGVYKVDTRNTTEEDSHCINFAKNHSLYLELEQIIKAIF